MKYNIKNRVRLTIVMLIATGIVLNALDVIEAGINDGQVGTTVKGVIGLAIVLFVALGTLALDVEIERPAPIEVNAVAPSSPSAVVDLTECDVSLKMLREALCIAQTDLDDSRDSRRGTSHRLQKLINLIDRHRPLDADGRHGNLHTATCGCEDKPNG